MCYRSRHIKRGPATLISSIAWQIPRRKTSSYKCICITFPRKLQVEIMRFENALDSKHFSWLSSVSLDPYQLILSRTFLDSAGNDSMHDIWRTGPIFSDDLDSLPNSGRSNNYSSRPRSITSALPLMTSNWLGALDFLQKPRSRELLWAKKCWSFNLTELPA